MFIFGKWESIWEFLYVDMFVQLLDKGKNRYVFDHMTGFSNQRK